MGISKDLNEPKEFKSFYKTTGGNEGNKCFYPTRLDTYGCGCSHNCKYCYAKSLLNFRNLWNPENPSVADIEKIKKKIRRLPKDTKALRLGGMTDCLQPIENIYHNTYETIKELNNCKIPYLIVTKSDLIADDKYISILDKNLAHIQITITTTDDTLSKSYENATVPSKRIKAIEKLSDMGFDVQVRLSPFIPEYIDFNILNNIECEKILVEFLRVNTWIRKWFDLDYSEYTIKQSNYSHLPLEKKLDYIQNIVGHFQEISVCEDESVAYDYWKNHFNSNPNDCCNLRI
jgi:DNA repair photolyase